MGECITTRLLPRTLHRLDPAKRVRHALLPGMLDRSLNGPRSQAFFRRSYSRRVALGGLFGRELPVYDQMRQRECAVGRPPAVILLNPQLEAAAMFRMCEEALNLALDALPIAEVAADLGPLVPATVSPGAGSALSCSSPHVVLHREGAGLYASPAIRQGALLRAESRGLSRASRGLSRGGLGIETLCSCQA